MNVVTMIDDRELNRLNAVLHIIIIVIIVVAPLFVQTSKSGVGGAHIRITCTPV